MTETRILPTVAELADLEWSANPESKPACPECSRFRENGHAEWCGRGKMVAILREVLAGSPPAREAPPTCADAVNHPPHYNTGKIEVMEFIEDQRLNFALGNVVKYACRARHKGDELQDLQKAAWYLAREIESVRG